MVSTVLSATMDGLKVEFVRVEADVSNGLPMLHMVGYLSAEVKDAGERVRTAIGNKLRLEIREFVFLPSVSLLIYHRQQ